MGRVVCAAVADDPALELAAAVARKASGERLGPIIDRPSDVVVSDRLEALTDAKVDVAVDFTRAEAVIPNASWYAAHHLHGVIGTTGITADDIEQIRTLAESNGTNFVVAPDFSFGGAVVLQMRRIAAKHFTA